MERIRSIPYRACVSEGTPRFGRFYFLLPISRNCEVQRDLSETEAAHLMPDPEWLQATLNDASEALLEVLAKLEANPDEETSEEILKNDLVHVYAKLNYAVNSARLGPAALTALSEDEVIAWPAKMPFLTFDEIDDLGCEEEDENAEA